MITFDLFSALIDARTGASRVLAAIAAERRWPIDGERLYDEWDRRNKASQRDEREWIPFAEHCRRSLAATYADLGLTGPATVDAAMLLGSVAGWPLWPDVAAGLPPIAARHRVGVLSNVDDDVFARTKVAALVPDDAVLTSERLRAYKPDPEIYRRARERAGGALVHVATSARDVRGALEAGVEVIRLRRPGHELDPDGPRPPREAAGLAELAELLSRGAGRAGG
ncbi:haloacid dehalogenase type II [Blastococcus jejuensis]|uniref:Haloacid dehalogenase type II n=1 Tax=Blastococcus jejuensis TaxID=351224 RepID=A0ABP6PFR7_9ACTN